MKKLFEKVGKYFAKDVQKRAYSKTFFMKDDISRTSDEQQCYNESQGHPAVIDTVNNKQSQILHQMKG